MSAWILRVAAPFVLHGLESSLSDHAGLNSLWCNQLLFRVAANGPEYPSQCCSSTHSAKQRRAEGQDVPNFHCDLQTIRNFSESSLADLFAKARGTSTGAKICYRTDMI